METIKCKHREQIKSAGHYTEIGTCSICGQQTKYPVDKLKEIPTVIKLGRIDGELVLPNHHYKLDLNHQDRSDLATAEKEARGKEKETTAQPPKSTSTKESLQFYRGNKAQMIQDLISYGKDSFLQLWKVKPQIISHLKSDKLYKKLLDQMKTPSPPSPELQKALVDRLPALPPWSENWAPEVQVRWLDIYEKLIIK
jgi:hypothetical protein